MNDLDSSEELRGDDAEIAQPDVVLLRPRSPWWAIAAAMGIATVSSICQVIGVIVFLESSRPGMSRAEFEKSLESLTHNGLLLSIITWLGLVVSLPLIWAAAKWVNRGDAGAYLGLRWPTGKETAGWLTGLVALLLMFEWLSSMGGPNSTPAFMTDIYRTAGIPLLLWLTIVVAAPIGEELMFRGLLFEGLSRSLFGVAGATFITSFLWAAIHTQYEATVITQIFVVGLLFAAARRATGSVILCMLMHAMMNLLAMVQVLVVMNS